MSVEIGPSSSSARAAVSRSDLTRWSLLLLDDTTTLPERSASFALFWPADDLLLINDGRQAMLRADDLAVVDRSVPFSVTAEGGWRAQLLDLGDRRIATHAGDKRQFAALPLDGTGALARIIKRLWSLLEDVKSLGLDDDLAEARIAEALSDLVARLATQRVDGRTSGHVSATIARARLLIEAHLADVDFCVAALADRMGLSPRHLSSMFAAAGTTTVRAILDARMRRARMLLTDPVNARRQIGSIAQACGFPDQAYFTRCFRRQIGVTPREFRQNGANYDPSAENLRGFGERG